MDRIGEAARDRGIDACIHPRTIGVTANFAQTDRLLLENDPARVHLVIETGHSTRDFTDLALEERTVALIRRHGGSIRLVELKD